MTRDKTIDGMENRNNMITVGGTRRACLGGAANALRHMAVDGMMRKHDLRDRVCSQWYMKVAPMNDVALSCLVDALLRVRQSGRWRKKGIRACVEATERAMRRYESMLSRKVGGIGDGVLAMFEDYMEGWNDGTRHDVTIMRMSVGNALLRMGYPRDVELASWVFTAYNMVDLANRIFDSYFDACEKALGVDCRRMFADGRLTAVMRAFRPVADSLDQGDRFALSGDEMCRRSMGVLANRLALDDIERQADAEAMRLNPGLAGKAGEAAEAEREFRERMRKRLERDVGLAAG